MLCGKGQRELNALREFATAATHGRPVILFGKGTHVREWLHPLDVSDAFLKGIEYFEKMTTPYQIFVLGGNPISMQSLAELVIREAGSGTIQYQAGEKEAFDQLTDASKVRNHLGWKALITTDEIVREVVADVSGRY